VCTVSMMEFEKGKSRRETQYFGNPFDAPSWRAQWVEPKPVVSSPYWSGNDYRKPYKTSQFLGWNISFPLKLNAARADKYLTCQARIRVPIAQLARSATRSASSRAVPLQLTQNVICMEVVVL
jgi:hypothetical protein